MDANEFRQSAKAVVDYIADYYENIRDRQVLPDVRPGYMRDLVPPEPPLNGESMGGILGDFERVVMPGLAHWQSPNFYAYYPASVSFPSIIGDLMSSGLGVVGINWMTCPAITELEVAMMDWLGKMLDVPIDFLNSTQGPGGGIIKGTASEATLVCLLAAKQRTLRKIQRLHPNLTESEIKGKLRAYSSDQSNSSIEKAGLIGSMSMCLLPSDPQGRLDPEGLSQAMQEDVTNGLFPCYVVATLGTTGTCAFDDLTRIGPICNEHDVWLHVDAAYAGAAFTCPEFRHLKSGLEFAHSFNFNAHKFMLVNFDCSVLWVKNSLQLTDAFTVERPYLKHDQQEVPEYLHWEIPLGRRFRALKIWFVLRSYGVEGIQKYIRKQVDLAKYLAKLVESDDRFELVTCKLGLVCFRIKGSDELTQKLTDKLTHDKKIYVLAYTFKDQSLIRMSINSNHSSEDDLDEAWKEIKRITKEILQEFNLIDLIKGKGFDIKPHIKIEKQIDF